MSLTHTFIKASAVEITTPSSTVKVIMHDDGELDFEGHEHLTEQEFQDVVEYVTTTFPWTDDVDNQSSKVIVEAFKKEYLELLVKYPQVTVAEDKHKNLVAYAINHIDEATVDLQHNIQNYAY